MAKQPTIKVEDLAQGEASAQEIADEQLDKVVGGIKDGTSNTLVFGEAFRRRAAARPRASDPDSGDELL